PVREQLAREHPVLTGLVREGDADRRARLETGGSGGLGSALGGAARAAAALRGAAGESHDAGGDERCRPEQDSLLHVISFLVSGGRGDDRLLSARRRARGGREGLRLAPGEAPG